MTFWQDQVNIVAQLEQQWYNVLDIGAFKGNTVAKYRELLPNSRVYAIEPLEEQVKALRERFKGDKNVKVYELALAGKNGEAQMFVGGAGGNESSLYLRPTQGRRYYLSRLKPGDMVQTLTLESWMEKNKLGHINIMKADVHGAFPEIVRGSPDVFVNQRVDVIGVEVYFVPMFNHALLYHELANLLEGYGYTTFGLYDFLKDRESNQLKVGNAIFVSDVIRREVLDNYPPCWTYKGDK